MFPALTVDQTISLRPSRANGVDIANAVSIPVIASGGLASINDIQRMLQPDAKKLEGAITGRALYDGRIDPEEALKMMETRSFDLVLLDIDMPKLNGMDLCTQMRLCPQHQFTPVVFFSQLSEIEYRMASMSAGGNDFIGKPYLTIELAVKALVWLNKPPAIAIA